MASDKIQSISGQLQALVTANTEFPDKLKQRLVSESIQVENPFKFIVELYNEGVLNDESNDLEAHVGFKEMLVQLAVTIGFSKGSDGISGLVKALGNSGNLQLLSALRTWAKEFFQIESNDGGLSDPKEGTSALQSPPRKKLRRNLTSLTTESSSIETRFIDKITSRMEDKFIEQLEGHLVPMVPEIVQAKEFCTSLVHQNVLEENDIQLFMTEKAIRAACSKKAIGSLVLALKSSNNERILEKVYDRLEASEQRKKNNPVAVNSLARSQPRPAATGMFAATSGGIISLDLRTMKATRLTQKSASAVAVNHNLRKVYWSQGKVNEDNSCILRSNFDGSEKEVIVPLEDDMIYALAIDDTSGKVYFARACSQQINICNELGENCVVVMSGSDNPVSIALDSVNGFIYWTNRSRSLIRANLDGSNPTTISTGLIYNSHIKLGQPSNDVLYCAAYWGDIVATIDVNSGNERELVQLKADPYICGIEVDANKIFFSTWKGRRIQCVDRDSGEELTTIYKCDYVVERLALFSAPGEP